MNEREVLIGVTGGIAAYKTAMLASQLVQSGIGVTVVMTRSARRFVRPATFAAISGRPVAYRAFASHQYPLGAHIELAQRAQLLCVAPASANFLAAAAHGLAGDLLSTLYLCFSGPVFMAPAMNVVMWNHPAVQRNLSQLQADGVQIVSPAEGWLSCRQTGMGRMADPEQIAAAIRQRLDEWPHVPSHTDTP